MNPKPSYRRNTQPHPASTQKSRRQRGEQEEPLTVPVVEFTVLDDGTMTVTIDGAPYAPQPYAPPWQRNSFPMIIDTLTAHYQIPIRVVVREADGSTFTDIITPPQTRTQESPATVVAPGGPVAPTFPAPFAITPPPIAAVPAHAPTHSVLPQSAVPLQVHEISAEGFVPGEDVAVAIITTHCDASNDGIARTLLTSEQLAASPTREIIMLGRVSGTLVVGRSE